MNAMSRSRGSLDMDESWDSHDAQNRTSRSSLDLPYAWKAKYGGMDVNEAQGAKQLRDAPGFASEWRI